MYLKRRIFGAISGDRGPGQARPSPVNFGSPSGEQIKRINALRHESMPELSAEDVYVMSCRLANDQVDTYSTRFTVEALEQIAELMTNVPLMRMHGTWRSEDLPVGRFFGGRTIKIGNVTWVDADFWWARAAQFSADMVANFLTGVWSEVSLSWWMSSFVNSIDGKPFSELPYYPGQEFEDGQIVIGIMSDIVAVDECSIVYRGGQIGTHIVPATAIAGDDRLLQDRPDQARVVEADESDLLAFCRRQRADVLKRCAPPLGGDRFLDDLIARQ